MFQSINPATGDVIARYQTHDDSEVERRLQRSWSAWQGWRSLPLSERRDVLTRLADLLDARAEQNAVLISQEMGKPLAEARAEIHKCAVTARHYAAHGADYLAARPTETEAALSQVQFEPLGPILAIMPWNFPWWQVIRFFVPALLAGNVALVKHAESVQGCAHAIEALVAEAAGREGLLQTVLVETERVADLIGDDRIRAVTLTGSVRAGRAVGAAAGANGKKAVLELGGSDPFIVLADADIDKASTVAVAARFANAGQSCISAKRFLVDRAVAGDFIEAFRAKAAALTLGDPLAEGTTMGPLARADLIDIVAHQVQRALASGATAIIGGERAAGPGYYYRPTILTGVDPHSPAAQEEVFGPAAAVMAFSSLDEMVAIANGTRFGLGASIWSRDTEAAGRLADRIEAGAVFVNDLVRSDPRLPFGGIKDSGHGRELGAIGATEFTNAKLKWIA